MILQLQPASPVDEAIALLDELEDYLDELRRWNAEQLEELTQLVKQITEDGDGQADSQDDQPVEATGWTTQRGAG
jgi:hypothetical protein